MKITLEANHLVGWQQQQQQQQQQKFIHSLDLID
jgi:hypothetical protein